MGTSTADASSGTAGTEGTAGTAGTGKARTADQPALFVVRGTADDEEIAAATVALLFALRQGAASDADGRRPDPASGWRTESYQVPGAWSSA